MFSCTMMVFVRFKKILVFSLGCVYAPLLFLLKKRKLEKVHRTMDISAGLDRWLFGLYLSVKNFFFNM